MILCCSALYNITLTIAANTVLDADKDLVQWTMLGGLGLQYIIFAIIFIVDRITVRLTVPRIKERISIIRNIYQWVLAPFILLGYSLIEFYALHEVMIKGREVCKHGASKKDDLKV